jgi:DNA-binding MarR family transcriptional regulator
MALHNSLTLTTIYGAMVIARRLPLFSGVRLNEDPRPTAPEQDADEHAARPAAINLGILPGLLGYQIKQSQERVYAGFAARLRRLSLTPGQFAVLVLVEANPGLTQTALARALGSNRSLMVRTLDRLEDAGLVAREPSPRDRRSHAIFGTEEGFKQIARLKADVRAHEDRIAAALGRESFDALLDLLVRLNRVGPAG